MRFVAKAMPFEKTLVVGTETFENILARQLGKEPSHSVR